MPEVGTYAYWHLGSAFCWFLAASMPQHVRQQHRTCPVPGFSFFRPHCELGLSTQLSCKMWAGAARAAGHGVSLCLLPTRVLRCSTRGCCLEEKQREWNCVWSPAGCLVSLGSTGRDNTWRSHGEIRVDEWQICGPWEVHQLGSVKNHQPQNQQKKSPIRMLPERIYHFIVFHEKQAPFQSHLEMTPGRRAALHPLQEHPTCTCSSQQTWSALQPRHADASCEQAGQK